jgi:hypothetical protein
MLLICVQEALDLALDIKAFGKLSLSGNMDRSFRWLWVETASVAPSGAGIFGPYIKTEIWLAPPVLASPETYAGKGMPSSQMM